MRDRLVRGDDDEKEEEQDDAHLLPFFHVTIATIPFDGTQS